MPWSPDNQGRALANERSDEDPEGPDALLATAPVRAIAFRVACEVIATHSGPDTVSRRWPTAMLPLVG